MLRILTAVKCSLTGYSLRPERILGGGEGGRTAAVAALQVGTIMPDLGMASKRT